jgi:Fe-S oxidoreductase
VACGICVEACCLFGQGVLADVDPVTVSEGRVSMGVDGGFHEAAYLFARACLRCGACDHVCPVGLDTRQINHLVRVVTASGDDGTAQRYRSDTAGLRRLLPRHPVNPFRMLYLLQTRPEDVRWYEGVPEDPPQVETVVFLSCVGMARIDRVHTLIDLLGHAGVECAVLPGLELCCGLLDALAGDLDTAQQHLDYLCDAVAAFGANELVVDCASCYGWFHDLAQTQELPFAVRHTTQLLAERVDRLPVATAVAARATVHDACHYGRRPGELEPVRRLLTAIPSLELVEMPRSGESTVCCGGPAFGFQPDVARRLVTERVEEAVSVGADLVLSACSGCVSALESEGRRLGVRADDVLTPLAESVGIAYPNRLKELLTADAPEMVLERAAGCLWELTNHREDLERFVAGLLSRRSAAAEKDDGT